jgi:hypothetical protein
MIARETPSAAASLRRAPVEASLPIPGSMARAPPETGQSEI